MNEGSGLICSYLLDGRGAGTELDWSGIRSWSPDRGVLWVHLDRTKEQSRRWVVDETGLDPLVSEALLEEETRPRCFREGEGLLMILRGVNLNPGADPEDMVSIRMWIDPNRVISLRALRIMAIQDIRDHLAAGSGPGCPGDFLAAISSGLIDRMAPTMEALEEEMDDLEEELIDAPSGAVRARLVNLRLKAIALHRYITPQRDVLARLPTESTSWLVDHHRSRLREALEAVTRHVEDLDSVRERASIARDEMASRLSEEMNNRMYILAIVAAVFLPLGFLTGLLGINVGGIPGTDVPWAFGAVCAILMATGVLVTWALHRLKWF